MKFLFLAIYSSLQLITFVIYGIDKYKAKRKSHRISEQFLLGITVFAPFGAYMAMHVFRHKTQKIYFWLEVIGMIIVHVTIAMFYYSMI